MSHSFACVAIVLKTYDVGEADRFCVLYTRERGRITARATGARRPGSRLGGYLLPYRHVALTLREGSGGFFVSSASMAQPQLPVCTGTASFAQAEQGTELFLKLVQHEETDDALFDAMLAFLLSCGDPSPAAALSFTVRLLHLLGLLPEEERMRSLSSPPLSDEACAFVSAARVGGTLSVTRLPRHLHDVCAELVNQHLAAPLKAPLVAARMG